MPFQNRGNNNQKKPWDRGGDRGGFRDTRGFDKPGMHRATCAKCNRSCEVPFKPNGSRPIYCSNCFKRDDDRPAFKPSFDRSSGGYSPEAKSMEKMKEQFNILNAKLDIILKALTKTVADEVAEDELEIDGDAPKKSKKTKASKK